MEGDVAWAIRQTSWRELPTLFTSPFYDWTIELCIEIGHIVHCMISISLAALSREGVVVKGRQKK